MALSHVNAKEKNINSKSWAFRMLWFNKRVTRDEVSARVSKRISGNLKIEVPSCSPNTVVTTKRYPLRIFSQSLMMKYLVINSFTAMRVRAGTKHSCLLGFVQ
jgi:hypothetical protein